MLCKEYISHDLFVAHANEPVKSILAALSDGDPLSYIAVEDTENKFLGIIETKYLKDLSLPIEAYEAHFKYFAINENKHILYALHLMHSLKADSLVLIDDTDEVVGEISQKNILNALSEYLSVSDLFGSIVVLEVNPARYSITEITQIVHSANADIMQYNTSRNKETGNIVVSLVLNKRDLSLIVATFQRYEYNIKYYFGDESYDNELQSNYDLLMKYINI